MLEEIEKPWCAYETFWGVNGFGKIIGTDREYAYIKNSEVQALAIARKLDTIKFKSDSLEDAVEYYIQNRPEEDDRFGSSSMMQDKEIRISARIKFPSYFKDKEQVTSN